MNRKNIVPGLSVLMLILGLAAFGLRTTLYAVAVDARGLLIRGHSLGIALAVLTVAAMLTVALVCRKLGELETEPDRLPENLLAALGNVAAGAGIALTVLDGAVAVDGYLANAWRFLGLAAPVCLVLAGFARVLGKRPFFLLHVAVCLFFLVHIVARYQLWSSHPQMQDYIFALLGAMTLMFFGFYEAAREAGCGNFRMQLGMGLSAVFLCLAELARSSCTALYLGGILWVLAELGGRKQAETNE